MIKPEQVPDEVVATVRRNLFCNASDAGWIVAAALNAWPGMEYHADIAFPAFGYGPNGFVLPLAQVDTRTNNTPEMPDGSTIVSQITPAGWDGTLYSVASEMKRLLTSASDHGTNIDSGTMDGRAYLWVCIDGVEYFITVERSSGRSKNNPFTTENENG